MKLTQMPFAGTLLFVVTAACALPLHTHQSPAPPDTPVEPANVLATLHNPPSAGVSLGALRVRFEETTLEDARRSIGVGTIAHHGDAGESMAWLCYTILGKRDTTRVWLSSGELEGTNYISDVTAESVAGSTRPTPQCPALPARFQPLSLDSGLWLGLPDAQFSQALGRPSHKSDPWRMFDYSEPLRHGQCERENWMWTKSTRGHVTLIDAGQTTSC